ncbi:response regulator transcription factor [candidate division KSB1 bacterium]
MAKKILIVDDEEDFLKAITIRLNHAGYETAVAKNGVEAQDYLKENGADLILLDVMMPKMDGLEFIKFLKNEENLKDVPVIFLTAGSFDIAEQVETLASAQDFMLKSVDNEQIIDRIEKII